jgi:hypothetical protein
MKTEIPSTNKTVVRIGIVISVTLAVMAGILAAQDGPYRGPNTNTRYRSAYDPKTQPPLEMTSAYELAMAYLGTHTNRFYCIDASCLALTKRGLPGWTFSFSNTNGQRATIEVTFDKAVGPDAPTSVLLEKLK